MTTALMENVRVTESVGSECLVCGNRIRGGERVLEVSFQLIMRVRKEAHVNCAEKMCELLKKKIKEARS